MANFLVENNFYQGTSDACIIDLTPPVFSGITGLDVESRGQIRASWSAATDPTLPIRYEIYIKAGSNVGLFSVSNIVAISSNLQYDIFTLPDGSFLVNGTTYFVGVRALDGVNNRDSNVVSQSVISTGVLTAIDVYESKASVTNVTDGEFKVVAWVNKNESLAIAPGAALGQASYTVYDSLGVLVPGFSGVVVSPNAQGLYVFPVVNNTLNVNESYQLRVSIVVDGEARINFVSIPKQEEVYVLDGVVSLNNSNNLTGSFWVENNGKTLTSGLSTGSYQVYLADGTIVPGISETGIVADANGFFTITPFALPGFLDITESYIARLTLSVDGQPKTKNLIIDDEPVVYDVKSVFSINALNQLEATFWATKNDEIASTVLLGTASYQIYDKLGNTVAGLNQSGIAADINGFFHTTPVSAILLTDLTHYTARVTITVAGKARTAAKGFSLLGT
jgi:hypothetical protein